jgi:hypothetical protein
MERTTPPRRTAPLSKSVQHQLNMYALAASAAGVAALCSAQPAEAKIVYTAAHVPIPVNSEVFFDLNHDGISDFGIKNYGGGSVNSVRAVATQNGIRGVSCQGHDFSTYCAPALLHGAKVGGKQRFLSGKPIMAATTYWGVDVGPWFNLNGRPAYLGIRFLINGNTHFAWARVCVSHSADKDYKVTVTGYAYETIPGKPIIAGATKGPEDAEPTAALSSGIPEPVTLGALALGAPGLSIWRRRESAAAALAAN